MKSIELVLRTELRRICWVHRARQRNASMGAVGWTDVINDAFGWVVEDTNPGQLRADLAPP